MLEQENGDIGIIRYIGGCQANTKGVVSEFRDRVQDTFTIDTGIMGDMIEQLRIREWEKTSVRIQLQAFLAFHKQTDGIFPQVTHITIEKRAYYIGVQAPLFSIQYISRSDISPSNIYGYSIHISDTKDVFVHLERESQ